MRRGRREKRPEKRGNLRLVKKEGIKLAKTRWGRARDGGRAQPRGGVGIGVSRRGEADASPAEEKVFKGEKEGPKKNVVSTQDQERTKGD